MDHADNGDDPDHTSVSSQEQYQQQQRQNERNQSTSAGVSMSKATFPLNDAQQPPINDIPPGIQIRWIGTSAKVSFLKPRPVAMCVVGRAKLKCLQGGFSVLGYEMDAVNNVSTEIVSPSWMNSISISQATEGAVLEIKSIRPNIVPTFCILNPENARPIVIPLQWRVAVDSIVTQMEDTKKNEANGIVSARQNTSMGHDDDDDDDGDESGNNNNSEDKSRARILICGAKGVGKSTCLRYATNRFLSSPHFAKVAILDADAGQPELGPPGLLTLSIVSRPLLAPPHWNNISSRKGSKQKDENEADYTKLVSACFYGSTTSGTDPSAYVDAVQSLLRKYENEVASDGLETKIPLLVNMDGWVHGIGYQLLTSMVASTGLHPSHILQLVGDSPGKTFDLTNVVGSEGAADTTLHVLNAFDSSRNTLGSDTNPKEMEELKQAKDLKIVGSSVAASILRELRLGTYFVPDCSIWDVLDECVSQAGFEDIKCTLAHTLAAARPYCVPMHAIKYGIVRQENQDIVSPDMILKALNASIVGLCTSRDHGSSDASTALECTGLGLIRSIDYRNQLFYILTPVDPSLLSSVTHIYCGNLATPLQFFFRGIHSEAFPYLSFDDTGNASKIMGSGPMQSRNSIQRRGIMMGNQNGK